MTITIENLFEGILRNFCYVVVRANNVVCEFSIANFPMMNLNDWVTVTRILSNVGVSKLTETNKDDFLIGFAHIKVFIDNYYDWIASTDIELTSAVNKPSKVPQSLLKGKINIDKYEDGQIINQPLGVVFQGKNKNGNLTKLLFQVSDLERYMNV